MTNNLKRQVEVQGTKKLDSVKGVQTLELKEMKDTEGGIHPIVWVLLGCALSQDIDKVVDSFNEGYKRARK